MLHNWYKPILHTFYPHMCSLLCCFIAILGLLMCVLLCKWCSSKKIKKVEETGPNELKTRNWKLISQHNEVMSQHGQSDCIIQISESKMSRHGQGVSRHEELLAIFQEAACRGMKNPCHSMPWWFKVSIFVFMSQHEGIVGIYFIFGNCN